VDVAAETVSIAIGKQPLCFMLCLLAVGAGKGGDVELEGHSFTMQTVVIVLTHISVTLGMGEKRMITFLHDSFQKLAETNRRVEIRCFHQKVIATAAHREQVVSGETLLNKASSIFSAPRCRTIFPEYADDSSSKRERKTEGELGTSSII